jgi:hypothetical protein
MTAESLALLIGIVCVALIIVGVYYGFIRNYPEEATDSQQQNQSQPQIRNIKKKSPSALAYVLVTILVILGIWFCSSSGLPGGPGARVTMDKFNHIQAGMSYRQAVDVIGFEGEEISRAEMFGIVTVMYSWPNSNGSNMNAMFQNDQMISKAQSGLP